MARHTLYAYVQGTDLEGVVAMLEPRLDALVEGRKWGAPDVWVVNQRVEGDKPEWDLGLNLALPASPAKHTAWVDDAVAVASAFAALHKESGRSFVIGLHDAKTDAVKDLFVIDTGAPDTDGLKSALTAAVR
jgi:hypothetical protein